MAEANCCGVQVIIQDGPITTNFETTNVLETSFIETPLSVEFTTSPLSVDFAETNIYVDIQTTSAFAAYINKHGSNLTGTDGDVNRTYELGGITMVVVDNMFLHPNSDYVYIDNIITFLKRIWNTQRITFWLS